MPAYKIGKGQRPTNKKCVSPGPSDYKILNDNTLRSTSKYSIGKEQRTISIISDKKICGPGEQEFQSFIGNTGPKQSHRSKNGSIISNTITPGPGAQEKEENAILSSHKKMPNYTFSRKSKSQTNLLNSVGPSDYDTIGTKYNIYGGTIGKQLRQSNKKIKVLPGPGAYEIQPDEFKRCEYTFGNELKHKEYKYIVPGPGSYNTSITSINPNITTSLKFKNVNVKSSSNLLSPGPADYDKQKLISTCYSVGNTIRFNKNNNYNPGPSDYNNCNIFNSPKYSIGKSKRKEMVLSEFDKPLIGVEPKSTLCMRSSSFAGRFDSINSQGNGPGPSSYHINNNLRLKKNPICKIGDSKRLNENKKVKSPGPSDQDAYKPDDYKIKSPRCTFGNEKRQSNKIMKQPGPGSQEYKTFIGIIPKYEQL